jgi:hypothetical protein
MTRFGAATAGVTTLGLVVASVLLGGSSAFANPANDDFAHAAPVSGASFTKHVSTVGATVQAGEPTETGDAATARSASVWLKWTALETTTVTLTAESDDVPEIGLAVFDGSTPSAHSQKAFSTDGELTDLAVTKGSSYAIQVSGVAPVGSEAAGAVTVSLATADSSRGDGAPGVATAEQTTVDTPDVAALTPPSNDNFSGARRVAGPSFFTFVDNSSASLQSGEYTKMGDETSSYSIFNSVWLKWVAPQSGYVTVDTDLTTAVDDTAIAIFTGTSPKSSNRKAWNDEANGLSDSGLSRINGLKVTKGVSYYIQVGTSDQNVTDAQADLGIIFVTLKGVYSAPSNDNIYNATTKTGTSWTTTVSDVGATIEPVWELTDNPINAGQPPLGSQWWKWKPLATGTINVNTEGSSDNDTYVAVYSLNKYNKLSRIDFDDDSGTSSLSSLTGIDVTTGSTYYIQAGLVGTDQFSLFDTYGVTDYDTGSFKLNFSATYTGPSVTKLSPSSGRLSGNTTVKIYGSRLNLALGVYFGGISGTIVDSSHSTYLVVKTPAGISKKKVYVQVITADGTSLVVTGSHYTYK